jgi:hypothetical protein
VRGGERGVRSGGVWCELEVGGENKVHDMRCAEHGIRYPKHRTVGSAVGVEVGSHVYTFVIATAGVSPFQLTICRAPTSTTYCAPAGCQYTQTPTLSPSSC